VIDPAGMETVDSGRPARVPTWPSGGKQWRMVANPNYWRQGELINEYVLRSSGRPAAYPH
jgi:hypothetical protein